MSNKDVIKEENLNLPYFPSEHRKHQLDLYRPTQVNGKGDFPVVLFVHGGGWKNGDRRWRNPFMINLYQNVGITLSKQGFVCAVISYRLSAINPWDLIISVPILSILFYLLAIIFGGLLDLLGLAAGLFWWMISYTVYILLTCMSLTSLIACVVRVNQQGDVSVRHLDYVIDVARAYKWITENIHQYGGDPKNIFLMGHSAGGHLVSLLALDHSYLKQLNTSPSGIKGVIGLSGVYNLGRLRKTGWLARWWYLYPLFGPNLLREILFSASPLTYVHKTGFNFLLVNATVDMHLPRDSEEFATALQREGVGVERFVVKGIHLASVAEIGKKKDILTPCLVGWMRRQMSNG